MFPGGVGVLGNAMRRPRGRLRLPAGVKAPAPPLPSQETRLIIISAPFRSNAPIHRSICSGSQWWEGPASRSRGGSPACLLLLVWRWGLRRVSCPAGPAASACARPSWPFSRSFSPVLPVAIRRSIQRLRLS